MIYYHFILLQNMRICTGQEVLDEHMDGNHNALLYISVFVEYLNYIKHMLKCQSIPQSVFK